MISRRIGKKRGYFWSKVDIFQKKWIFSENHLLFSVISRKIGKNGIFWGKKWIFLKKWIFEESGYFRKNEFR